MKNLFISFLTLLTFSLNLLATTVTYTYDKDSYRLTKVTYKDDKGNPIKSLIYNYDSNGNILSITSIIEDNKSYSEINAAPENALEGIKYSNNLKDIDLKEVTIEPNKFVKVQPSMTVESEYIGQIANLFFYIYLPSYKLWIPFKFKSKILESSTVIFDNIPYLVDLSKASGLEFQVWYGYNINKDTYINAYQVLVK